MVGGLVYLIDTNVLLELLLEQERAEEVRRLLETIALPYITEFSFYSIGIILTRLRKANLFLRFVDDLFIDSRINLVRAEPEDMKILTEVLERFNLNFDDAYQYVIAEKFNLQIISFDSDFDRTKRGRKTPADILKELSK